MDKKTLIFSLVCSVIFYVMAFITLNDYGISWDETLHFSRGQAYVYYFLTGKTDYGDLPNYNLQGTLGKPEISPYPRRSFYQLNDFHNGVFFINDDIGHPPINDEVAAIFNYVFFQKLGIINDIQSYHLFNIFTSAVLVFIVAFFAYEVLGLFPALVSVLALTTYPLFWAESHFNIKDPPLTAFFAGFIWAFYKSLKSFSVKWLALSILFFSLGLGTKFNIFFVIPIIIFYVLFQYGKNIFKVIFSLPKKYLIVLLLAPVISLGILTISWPLLWHNWLSNFFKIINYYKDVGTVIKYQPSGFYILGFNTFPIKWIFYTTPPVVIFLSVVGLISAWFKRKTNTVFILWILWLFIPILRVTFPGTSVYGGVRQIMEYIPAMALLSGLGAYQIGKWTKNNRVVLASSILIFIWPIFILFKLHPNENVYFNFLIGGLKGAQSRNFPSWGNSFGNAYFQGIRWINENVEEGAKLSLIQGTRLNVPPILVRKDIDFSGTHWSGINREGEYLMELTFNDTAREFNYAWEYVNKFLNTVYELKVDGVPILKVWKNDWEHTKKEYQLKESSYNGGFTTNRNSNFLEIDMRHTVLLSRIVLNYRTQKGCTPLLVSYLDTSLDGQNWQREKDWIPYPQVGLKLNDQDGVITFFLAGRKAQMLRFWFNKTGSCALMNMSVKITELVW